MFTFSLFVTCLLLHSYNAEENILVLLKQGTGRMAKEITRNLKTYTKEGMREGESYEENMQRAGGES